MENNQNQKEMSFLGHLEELRWHIVRSLIALTVIAVCVFIFRNFVYNNFLTVHLDGNFVTYRFFCEAFNLLELASS